MAKCTIVSHDGDGLYTVQMLPDSSIIETKIEKLTGELVDIDNVEYLEAEVAYLDAKAVTDAAQVAVDAAIDVYALAPTEVNLAAVTEATEALGEAVNLESQAKIPFDLVKARKLAIEKQIARYSAVNVSQAPVQVWCADRSDGLKNRGLFDPDDIAGTIEILGNAENGSMLQPQYAGLGLYDDVRDGITMPTAALDPATYFYNRAMTPGWQKWQNDYRPGIITGVDAGGFDVTLDNIKSGEQAGFIPVNDIDDGILSDVPAEYMNCNELAFEVGDHVIVKTEYDSYAPDRTRTDTIIGFVDNPKSCNVNGFNYHPFVIGGTQPGFHDWQNLQPEWFMKTPVLSDVISDGGDVVDWKGFLTDSTPILAQWEHQGDTIYIDGIKMAVVPVFALSYATGDPFTGGSNIATGFYAAWVTEDNQYIYAVTYEQVSRTRHVLRKTNVEELTGGAYNAGTLPDGWEVSAAFGPASFTDFLGQGTVFMNQSGTEGRALDLWVHGAARTPQLPSDDYYWTNFGVWELTPAGYDSFWTEESVLTITTPSAATIAAAGISCSFLGKQSDFIFKEDTSQEFDEFSGSFECPVSSGNWYWGYTEATGTGSTSWSGKERQGVGYEGDTPGYIWLEGVGIETLVSSWKTNGSCVGGVSAERSLEQTRILTPDAGGLGRLYTCDFASWREAYDLVITLQDTLTFTRPEEFDQTGQVLSETNEYNHNDGSVGGDINNRVYTHLVDDYYWKYTWDQTGPFSSSPNPPTGTTGVGLYFDDTYKKILGLTELDFNYVDTDLPYSTSPNHTGDRVSDQYNIFVATGPPPHPDEIVTGPLIVIKANKTGIKRTRIQVSRMDDFQYARDHVGNYIASYQHRYNPSETTEYGDYLDNGDLGTLDGLDNGTGTKYINPHVAN